MAEILENLNGRRVIKISTDDIISIVREYQNTVCGMTSYAEIRNALDNKDLYIPEDF